MIYLKGNTNFLDFLFYVAATYVGIGMGETIDSFTPKQNPAPIGEANGTAAELSSSSALPTGHRCFDKNIEQSFLDVSLTESSGIKVAGII